MTQGAQYHIKRVDHDASRLNSGPNSSSPQNDQGNNEWDANLPPLRAIERVTNPSAIGAQIESRMRAIVSGLGVVELNCTYARSPNAAGGPLGPERTYQHHEGAEIRLIVDRESHKPSIASFFQSFVNTKGPQENPSVTIHARDVKLPGTINVIVSSGLQEANNISNIFNDFDGIGPLSASAGQMAEAYALGAFFGCAMNCNSSMISKLNEELRSGASLVGGPDSALPLKNYPELGTVLRYGRTQGFNLLRRPYQGSEVRHNFPDYVTSDFKALETEPRSSLFITEILENKSVTNRVTLDAKKNVVTIESLDKKQRVVAKDARVFSNISDAAMYTCGAIDALNYMNRSK